jgi:hypothetical protein
LLNLLGFTAGCAAAAAAYWSAGFACVALTVPVALVAAALTP